MKSGNTAAHVLVLAVLLGATSGCYCRFRAFRATGEGETFRYSDEDEVTLPLLAPSSIPIFHEKGAEASRVCTVELPARTHETIGAVKGAADDDWPTTVVESNLRRAAQAVKADAVVMTTPLVFSKLHSGYTYYGRLIRWRESPEPGTRP